MPMVELLYRIITISESRLALKMSRLQYVSGSSSSRSSLKTDSTQQNILAAKAPSNVIRCPEWNVSTRSSLDEELTFIHPDDVDLYNTWDSRAFELQVANHELLGHGTGKLFEEGPDGKKNFDPTKACVCHTFEKHFQQRPAIGNQSSHRKTYVRTICMARCNIWLFASLVRLGTSPVRLQVPFLEKSHLQWRNAVRKPLQYTVSTTLGRPILLAYHVSSGR